MKIIEIIPVLFDGGAERFIVDLSNEIAKTKDNEVVLVSLFNNDKSNFLVRELLPSIRLIELGKKPGFDVNIIWRLFKLIKKEKPDIVHSHLRAIEYLLPIMSVLGPKFFHTVHNDAFKECPGKLSRKIRNIFYSSGKCVPVTISDESSTSYIEAYKNNKNIQILNGRPIVPETDSFNNVANKFLEFRKTKNTKVFVNIARVTRQKNQIMLANTFHKLIKDGCDVVLLIIGRVEDKQIFSEIEKLVCDRIFFLHSQSNPIDYLYLSDAFCLSSIFEGMPITIIEAFQAGCIPICTPVGGVKNMIRDSVNGLLSDDCTQQKYLNKVVEFLQLPESNKTQLSQNCKQTFHDLYNIQMTGEKYSEQFKLSL